MSTAIVGGALVLIALLILGARELFKSSQQPVSFRAAQEVSASAERAARHAGYRAGAAVVCSLVVLVAVASVGSTIPSTFGLLLALAPGIGAGAGLLLFAATPPARAATEGMVIASLERREPWSFGSRRLFLTPTVIAVAFPLFLMATGITASGDESGLSREISFSTATHSSAAGPYPGWFYGAPLICVTALLAGAMFMALRRISTTPSLPDPGLAELDARWRTASTRVVVFLGTAALLGYFGGAAVLAGQAIRTLVMNAPPGSAVILSIGILLTAGGAGPLIAAIIIFSKAMTAVASLRSVGGTGRPQARA